MVRRALAIGAQTPFHFFAIPAEAANRQQTQASGYGLVAPELPAVAFG
jgi:hypothetical protein